MATSMKTKIDKLTHWFECHPMKLFDGVYDVAYDYFDDEESAQAYFDDFYMSTKNTVDEIIEEEVPYGYEPTSDEVVMHYNVSILTSACLEANFMRQQLAQGEDFDDVLNLEAELCRKYPLLRKAFDILDKDEEPVTEESTVAQEDESTELPF